VADLADIRAGLAANLEALPGVQVSAYALSNPTPPCVEIVPSEIQYDRALQRGHDEIVVTVRVFVGLASDIGAQKRLDEHLAASGASSVKAAIEADATLAGAVDDARVRSATGYRVYGADGRLLGAEWEVEILG
jgi:hypothetical protein